MRWITHQAGALIAGAALGLTPPAMAACACGAVLPDIIDQRLSGLACSKKSRQRKFNRIHRGASHWFGWWLVCFLLALWLPLPWLAREAVMGASFGALAHVGLDMLTPRGIPLFPHSSGARLATPLCSTGRWSEYVFLGFMVALALVFLGPDLAARYSFLWAPA